ncbi:unnamed protein product [Paramecium octaurelia]|uniref:Uncharacterized protein n=1 Tax=Paramecium octaurelia TaxID=43137 RepID=A0A8S1X8F3_PAROT|nr:unnamed protein product [Paramecium octaurelia]
MSIKEVTQIQYQQQGFLYKDETDDNKWLNEFFNDGGQDGNLKKDIRSCSFVKQKATSFQFEHKSISEFLIASGIFEVLMATKDFEKSFLERCMKILEKNEKKKKQLDLIERNFKKIMTLLRIIKQRDLNNVNYSTQNHRRTRKFLIQKIASHRIKVLTLCIAPDDSTLASGSFDRSIRLWNIQTGQQRCLLEGQNDFVQSLCFSPDQAPLASGNYDCSIRLWDVKSGLEKTKLDGHQLGVYSVCFSPLMVILQLQVAEIKQFAYGVSRQDKKIKDQKGIADVFSQQNSLLLGQLQLLEVKINLFAFGTSGWDKQNKYLKVIKIGFAQYASLETAIYSHLVLKINRSVQGILGQVKERKGQKVIEVGLVQYASLQMALYLHLPVRATPSPYGIQIQCKKCIFWKAIMILYFQIGFSPDSNLLVLSSYDKSIHLWDISLKQDKKLQYRALSACLSPDGTPLATGCLDKLIRLWDLKSGDQKMKLIGHNQLIESVTFSPDGTILASGSFDASIYVWDRKSGIRSSELKAITNLFYHQVSPQMDLYQLQVVWMDPQDCGIQILEIKKQSYKDQLIRRKAYAFLLMELLLLKKPQINQQICGILIQISNYFLLIAVIKRFFNDYNLTLRKIYIKKGSVFFQKFSF